MNIEQMNKALEDGRVDVDTKLEFISASEINNLDAGGSIDKSPLYQRPYTKRDGQKGYFGDEWQKSLIVAFLTGKFIQPIHWRLNPKTNKWEIVDGGHRTRTILNFIKGLLKTPNGFTFEWKGESYDLGNKFWSEITMESPKLASHLLNYNYFLVIKYPNMDDKDARKKFLTLNNLHNMKDAEKRNAYTSDVATLCRTLGAVDFSKHMIFNKYDGGKMKYISLKSIGRETDAFVTSLVYLLSEGSSWTEGGNRVWNELYSVDESLTDDGKSKFKLNGVIAKEAKLLIQHLNDMVIDNAGRKGYGKQYWGVHRMLKYLVFLKWIFSKYDVNSLTFNYKKFVDSFDKAVADIKIKHKPYQRYEIVNNKINIKKGTESTDIDALEYHPTKVFGGGTRIDDYEFILKHVELNFDLSKFGITKGTVRENFEESDVWDTWAEQDFKCKKCEKGITRSDVENDHIIPVKVDGETSKSNLQLLCKDCNRNKSAGMDTDDLLTILQKKGGTLTPEQIRKIGEALAV
jgi:hypothetical protein